MKKTSAKSVGGKPGSRAMLAKKKTLTHELPPGFEPKDTKVKGKGKAKRLAPKMTTAKAKAKKAG
jgi:hypothetical protein